MNRMVKLCLVGSLVLAILGLPALSLGPDTAGAQACLASASLTLRPVSGDHRRGFKLRVGHLGRVRGRRLRDRKRLGIRRAVALR